MISISQGLSRVETYQSIYHAVRSDCSSVLVGSSSGGSLFFRRPDVVGCVSTSSLECRDLSLHRKEAIRAV